MKTTLLFKYTFIISLLLAITPISAQVGINTTSPSAGSMLDIESTDKGMLAPRVDITNLNTIAPITGGATESLLVYNTNTTTGKGFYYWSGGQWIPIESDDWKKSGNLGTTPVTDFVGTTDNVDLSFRTNNTEKFRMTSSGYLRAYTNGTVANPLFSWAGDPNKGFYSPGADQFGIVTNGIERLRIPNANQVYAMANGTNAAPFYSWSSDSNSGLWRSTTDRVNISAGGREMVEFNENGNNSEVVFNDDATQTDFRVETPNETNTFYIDAANDNIGLATNNPNASAQLEMADNNRGILINRVALSSTGSAAPVTSPATGLLVYNTATASSGSTQVLPGFYYWNGSQWVAMGGTGGRDWSLAGNAGTSASTNFLGTTDATDFVLRTSNTERMRFLSGGTAAIGAAPFTNVALRVSNSAQPFGLYAETSSTGVAVYGEDTGTGLGVFGTSSNNHGIYGTTAFTGSAFLIGGVIGWGTGANFANGMLAVTDQQASTVSNIGIRAVSGSTTSISSAQVLNVGVNTNATDLALYALSEGPITSNGDMEAARFQTNYTGVANDPDSRDPRAQLAGYIANAVTPLGTNSMYYGGYFYSGRSSSNSSYAYAGARFGNTNYKIIGNGTVSTVVEGLAENDTPKVMFAPEAPEVLFEDYGVGQLINGAASIAIDPIFTKNIVVDQNHPLKVFIQLEGDCNGVYVTNKTANGFTVKELKNGNSTVSFSWHIVANRKSDIGRSPQENVYYSDMRFPDAPKAILPQEGNLQQLEKSKFGSPLASQNTDKR